MRTSRSAMMRALSTYSPIQIDFISKKLVDLQKSWWLKRRSELVEKGATLTDEVFISLGGCHLILSWPHTWHPHVPVCRGSF